MLRLLAFVVFMTGGLILSLWSRFVGLLMYVWFALFRPQEWLFHNIAAFRFSLVLGVMLAVLSFMSGIMPTIGHPVALGMIGMLGSSFIAQLTTEIPGNGWVWVDQFARLTFVCCLAISILDSRLRIIIFVATCAVSIGTHSAKAGLVYLLSGGASFIEGIGGAYIDNNAYAMVGAMAMPFMIATGQLLRLGRSEQLDLWVRRGFYAAAALTILTIIGTRSRSGFLALIVVVLSQLVLQRQRLRTIVIAAALLGVGYLTVPVSDDYVARLETIRTYEEQGEMSALGRLHFWRVAMDMALDNPLGVGPFNFDFAYDRYDFSGGLHGRRRSVHSSHLQALTEFGFLGFFIWTSLFLYAFRLAWRLRRMSSRTPELSGEDGVFLFSVSNALISSMGAFVVAGAFISLAMNDLTWYTFVILAATERYIARTIAEARAKEQPPPALARAPVIPHPPGRPAAMGTSWR